MNERTFLWIIMGEEGESRKQWGANEENLFLGDRFSKQVVENKPSRCFPVILLCYHLSMFFLSLAE